jgi:hypothetical protein
MLVLVTGRNDDLLCVVLLLLLLLGMVLVSAAGLEVLLKII